MLPRSSLQWVEGDGDEHWLDVQEELDGHLNLPEDTDRKFKEDFLKFTVI